MNLVEYSWKWLNLVENGWICNDVLSDLSQLLLTLYWLYIDFISTLYRLYIDFIDFILTLYWLWFWYFQLFCLFLFRQLLFVGSYFERHVDRWMWNFLFNLDHNTTYNKIKDERQILKPRSHPIMTNYIFSWKILKILKISQTKNRSIHVFTPYTPLTSCKRLEKIINPFKRYEGSKNPAIWLAESILGHNSRTRLLPKNSYH